MPKQLQRCFGQDRFVLGVEEQLANQNFDNLRTYGKYQCGARIVEKVEQRVLELRPLVEEHSLVFERD